MIEREQVSGEEIDRLKRIEELMTSDPPAESPEGLELSRLVDEQIEAEKHIDIFGPDWKPFPNWNPND